MHSWIETNTGLKQTLTFQSFSALASFLVEVGKVADENNHHPDCVIRQAVILDLTLVTHDAANSVTQKDHEMAQWIDQILANQFSN